MVSGKGVKCVAVSALFSHCFSLRSVSATSARALRVDSSSSSGASSFGGGRMPSSFTSSSAAPTLGSIP